MNEYTLTLSFDNETPSTIVLTQQNVNNILDEFALPAAVYAAENAKERTVDFGTLTVSHDNAPMWHQQVVAEDVFANMLGDALIMCALRQAQELTASSQPDQEPNADN